MKIRKLVGRRKGSLLEIFFFIILSFSNTFAWNVNIGSSEERIKLMLTISDEGIVYAGNYIIKNNHIENTFGGEISSIGSDGTVYTLYKENQQIYLGAFDPYGNEEWSVSIGSTESDAYYNDYSAIAIDDKRATIFFLMWKYRVDFSNWYRYYDSFTIYAYDITGNFLWKKELKLSSSYKGDNFPSFWNLSLDGEKVYVAVGSKLYAINEEDGSIEWTYTATGAFLPNQDPVISGSGYILLVAKDNFSNGYYLYCITQKGNLKWKYPLVSSDVKSVVADDKNVYLLIREPSYYYSKPNLRLISIDLKTGKANLSKTVLKDTDLSGSLTNVSPAIFTKEGYLLVMLGSESSEYGKTEYQYDIFKVSTSNGTITRILSGPQTTDLLGYTNVALSLNREGKLCYLASNYSKSVGQCFNTNFHPVDVGWPMLGQNSRHTGVAIVKGNSNSPPAIYTVTANPSSGEVPLVVSFSCDAEDLDGKITAYKWDFDGDGKIDKTTTTNFAIYRFSKPGVYNATVTVVDDDGEETSKSIVITVTEPNASPIISSLNATPKEGKVPLIVAFSCEASDPEGSDLSYYWDFNGDGQVDKITQDGNTTYTFLEPGNYTVNVTVVDDVGNRVSKNTVVKVLSPAQNHSPVIKSLTVNPSSGEAPLLVNISCDAVDPDGDTIVYKWDFNRDGIYDSITTSNTITHLFPSPGSYKVTVEVVDSEGAMATKSVIVNVLSQSGNQYPIIKSFSATPQSGQAPLVVKFQCEASDPDGSALIYEWDFNGDGIVDKTTDVGTVSHIYSKSGNYNVTVSVIDEDGGKVSKSIKIKVENISETTPEIESLTATPNSGELPLTVNFACVLKSESNSPLVFKWDFNGDGIFDLATSINKAVHVYSTPGIYTVAVKVIDEYGNSVSKTTKIQVFPQAETQAPIIQNFNAYPVAGEAPLTVNFNCNVLNDENVNLIYQWDFNGDGQVDRITNSCSTSFTYTSSGSYKASVSVVNPDGKISSASTEINVAPPITNNPPIIENLTVAPESGYEPLLVKFICNAKDPENSKLVYKWDFDGDGVIDKTTTLSTVKHLYIEPGTYTAVVTVVDSEGATDSRSISISVYPSNEESLSVASLEANPSTGNVPLDVSFSCEINQSEGAIFEWDFDGDGNVDLTTHKCEANYTYTVPGFYNATLTIINDSGKKLIKVIPINTEAEGEAVIPYIQGWNLLGTSCGFKTDEVFDTSILTAWVWREGRWFIWSKDEDILSLVKKYGLPTFSFIKAGEGFWINGIGNGTLYVDLLSNCTSIFSLKPGWNLLGTSQPITLQKFYSQYSQNVKYIWIWKNGIWKFWSPLSSLMEVAKIYGIPTIRQVEANMGFWVRSK